MPTRAQITEVAARTWFVKPSWVNVALFETDEGLVMVDAGFATDAAAVHAAVRSVSDAPLHTVVFTHGHVDHAFGLKAFLAAGDRPRIVAHEHVAARFRRYARTAGYNARINATQFQIDPEAMRWPQEDGHFFWPDLTYRDELVLTIGGEEFHLRHALGETDDATWVWVPGRKALACGDLWFNVAPNCGNPQKVQRYPEGWADAADAMAGLGAEVLLPGHDTFQTGADHIRRLFTVQAEYLRAIVDQTLAGLNAGLTHDEIVDAVVIPPHLAAEPSLQPFYDRPEFIARNVIRQYGGWWNGRPADLLPAPADARAREVVALAGGV
ncbi:MAG: MBL fold metallo-hydrolase, partial [Actinobacteria bacterium]|nr:MBL fold metallo-hydrolase [Actinomycetota bacterium]